MGWGKVRKPDLPPIERLQAMRLEPGDVLVVKPSSALSADVARRLYSVLEDRFPGHKVVITSGFDLEVARPAQEPSP